MSNFTRMLGQCVNIPTPTLTERNLPDQSQKVCIITGANTGVGFELAKILYGANARVYIAGRSVEKCAAAVESLKALHPNSKGSLEVLKLDLADLTTIKGSASQFLEKEKRLDILWNNAGVMMPPRGSKTIQEHELQMGTNCLGPFLFSKFLLPILKDTAATSPPNSVRVAWAGSLAIDAGSPPGGVKITEQDTPHVFDNPQTDYAQSKAGNLFLASDFAQQAQDSGIVSVCFNPGNLSTELQRHVKSNRVMTLAVNAVGKLILYPAKYGAYTELYCGLSDQLTTADNGSFIAPWGRKSSVRADILAQMHGVQGQTDGKVSVAKSFSEYCNSATREYM